MRITESKLRSIIRSVIRESIDLGELDSKVEDNIKPLRDKLKVAYPPSQNPDFYEKVTDERIRAFLHDYLKNKKEIGSDATSKFAASLGIRQIF